MSRIYYRGAKAAIVCFGKQWREGRDVGQMLVDVVNPT